MIFITYNTQGDITGWATQPPYDQNYITTETSVDNLVRDYQVIDRKLQKRDLPYSLPEPYYYKRSQEYNIGHELGLLVDDIESGVFGNTATTGKFYQYVMAIKNRYPK
jgi:hypothetical protein